MNDLESILLSWSGGKDSALALYEVQREKKYRVDALVTTVTKTYDRISMHGVRRVLLERQAASLGIKLEIVYISPDSSNEEYESQMAAILARYNRSGITKVAFGDIFLEDLRKYREEKLSQLGMQALFPIWKRDTKELSRSLIELGFGAITTCVDTKALDKNCVGRVIDAAFLAELPVSADSCGENGEYHSFVFSGPILKSRIDYSLGEKVLRDERFYFCDLIPKQME
jgi:uncharacterized protein (TIGR00290 family)